MRKYFFYFALLLLGCSGNGDGGPDGTGFGPSPVAHVPEVSSFSLSPVTATFMQGDGTLVVTAEIGFRDAGLDIQALWIQMPDGTSLQMSESFSTETGTFTETIVMPTDQIGTFPVEIWLVDGAGDSSVHHTAEFAVTADVQGSDWTSRLSGQPALKDVIWDGAVFIAVGDDGTILTSTDGIDWVAREFGTEANLNAIAFFGPDIFAVGEDIVLLSTDHGENWITKHEPAVCLTAIEVTPTQVVVGGGTNVPISCNYDGLAPTVPQVMISEDRGNSWQDADSLPISHGAFDVFEDLIYRDGLFVAVTGSGIEVSSNGSTWNEIIDVAKGPVAFYTIVHDGARFIAAGYGAVLFASFDGYNWTETQTPVPDVGYFSAAWSGSKLMLAGGLGPAICVHGICPTFKGPHGIASTDGGVTWEVFNIDSPFENAWYDSLGLAWSNGRFVSVGRFWPSGEGKIFTAD